MWLPRFHRLFCAGVCLIALAITACAADGTAKPGHSGGRTGGGSGSAGETGSAGGGAGGRGGASTPGGGGLGGGSAGLGGAVGGDQASGSAGQVGGLTGGTGGAANGGVGGGSAGEPSGPFTVLVFSKTAGFRHTSIAAGLQMFEALAGPNDFTVRATEDAAVFSDAGLSGVDAVVFLNTTGNVFAPAQEAALQRFIESGGAWLGIHAASDTEGTFGWAWYRELVGAIFDRHTRANVTNTLSVEPTAESHPAVSFLQGNNWEDVDEWYFFDRSPEILPGVQVLLRNTIDNRPMAWSREIPQWNGGRAFYTARGHRNDVYDECRFRAHVLGGMLWALGRPSQMPIIPPGCQ